MSKFNIDLGDLIAVKREDKMSYWHWGVYIGEGMIMHFSGPGFSLAAKSEATVHKVTWKEFVGDSKTIKCRRYCGSNRDEVIKKAFCYENNLFRGQEYDVLTNNCEHFATWCHGEARSEQVEDVIIYLYVAVVAGIGIIGAIKNEED